MREGRRLLALADYTTTYLESKGVGTNILQEPGFRARAPAQNPNDSTCDCDCGWRINDRWAVEFHWIALPHRQYYDATEVRWLASSSRRLVGG